MSISAPRVRQMGRALDGIAEEDVTVALSTRSLNTSYTGPCVQVRRDPPENSLVFVSKVDGSYDDRLEDVAVSATGDVYVVGRQRAATFYNAQGASTLVGGNYSYDSPCITKYAKNGAPIWAADIDGAFPQDSRQNVTVGSSGEVFVHTTVFRTVSSLPIYTSSGSTFSLPWQTVGGGYGTALVNYTPNGNVVWAGSVRSTGYNMYSLGSASDQAGGAYICGACYTGNSSAVSNVTMYDSAGVASANVPGTGTSGCAFVTRYSATGNVLWAASMTSFASVTGFENRAFTSVAPDGGSGVFVSGDFSIGANVNHANGTSFTSLTNAGRCICLARYDPAGTVLAAFKVTTDRASRSKVASDSTGNVYVAGLYDGRNIYHSNNTLAGQIVAPIGTATFLAKFNSDLKAEWWTSLDGAQTETLTHLAADAQGVYLTGSYATTAGGTANIYHANTVVAGVLPNVGNGGGFFIRYSPSGNVTSWSSTSSGSIEGIALDPIRNRAMVVGFAPGSANIMNQSGAVLATVTGEGEAGFLGGFQLGITTKDIGFKNGSLDTSALLKHCPVSSNGYIQTWYSQTPLLEETPLIEEYPPAPLTADTTTLTGQAYGNGTYVANASSVYQSQYGAWKAFDRISSLESGSFWHSALSTYSGRVALNTTATVDGVGVPGEWLEIRLPSPIILSGYGITPREFYTSRAPADFTIAGSLDGIVWTQVDTRTGQTGYTANTMKQFMTSSVTPYQYYRIIVSTIVSTQDNLNIGEWRLYSSYSDRNARQFVEQNQPLLIQNGVIKTTNRPLIDFSGGKSLVIGNDATAAGTPMYTANTSGLGQSTYTTTISSGEVIGVRSAQPNLTENQQFAYGSTPNTLQSARGTIGSTPVLDTLSQNAQTSCLAAYSFRRLSLGYKGPVVRLRKTFEYPPLPLTSNTTIISGQPYGNGTYVASASTGTTPFIAFNRTIQSHITPDVYTITGGYYSGSTVTTVGGVDVLGEWIQLAMPTSIPLAMYSIKSSSATDPYRRRPRDWIVAGSNDGATWDLVDSQTGELWANLQLGEYKQFYTILGQAYTMFRLIVKRSHATDMYLSDVRFYPTLDVERDFYGSSSAIDAWLGTARAKVSILYDQSSNGKNATQIVENYQPYAEKQFGTYVAYFNKTVPHYMTLADLYPASFWAQYYVDLPSFYGFYVTLFSRIVSGYVGDSTAAFRHGNGRMSSSATSGSGDILGSVSDTTSYWMINGQYGSNNQDPKYIAVRVWNRVTGSRMTAVTQPVNTLGLGRSGLGRDFNGSLAELIFWSKPALVSDALLLDASPFPKTTSTYVSQTLNTTIGRLGALVSRGFPSLLNAVQVMSSFASTSSGPRTGSGPLILNNQNFGNFQYMVKRGSVSIGTGYVPTDYFSSVKDTAAAIVVIDGNLTIQSGCIFTPPTRKLFTILYITGNLILDGEISMTARGANHNATGDSGFTSVFPAQDIRVYTGEFGDLFGATNAFVPAGGGAAGTSLDVNIGFGFPGGPGGIGTVGNSGGGGKGGNSSGGLGAANGGAGTSFSGGTGGGGSSAATIAPLPGEPNGGLGGAGALLDQYDSARDGAGNGPTGTGGTLFVICKGTVSGSGRVTSHGSVAPGPGGDGNAVGGSSGGGSAWLLCGNGGDTIKVTSRGGERGGARSGLGGNGSAMKISLKSPSISSVTRSSVIGAYSLRRLISSWGGPVVRIRHGTTNEERNFYAEDLEVGAAMDTFLGGAIPYIAVWWDQSGSNNHATQTTTTSQPWIVRDASWTTRPTVRCGGTGFLNYNGTGLVNTNYTVAVSTARTSNKANNYFLGGTTLTLNQNLILGYRSNTIVTHDQWTVVNNMTIAEYTAPIPETYVFRHSSTVGKDTNRNGSFLGQNTTNLAPITAYAGSAIGRFSTNVYNGDISEVVLCASYMPDTERSLLESSMITALGTLSVGLVLHLDAFQHTSGSTTWTDISGSGYNFDINAGAYTVESGVSYMNFGGSFGIAKRVVGGVLTEVPPFANATFIVFTRILNSNATYRSLVRGSPNDTLILVNTGTNTLGMFDTSTGFKSAGYNVSTGGMVGNWSMGVWKLSSSSPYYQFSKNKDPTAYTITDPNAIFTNGFITIGGLPYTTGSADVNNAKEYWGDVGQFMYYNRHLSQTEIDGIYDMYKGRYGLA